MLYDKYRSCMKSLKTLRPADHRDHGLYFYAAAKGRDYKERQVDRKKRKAIRR